MLVATHGRLMRMALEGREPSRTGARRSRRACDRIVALVCRSPVARAVFAFTMRTLLAAARIGCCSRSISASPSRSDRRRQPGRGALRAAGFARPTVPSGVPLVFSSSRWSGSAADRHSGRTESELDRPPARAGGSAAGVSGVRTALIVAGVLPPSRSARPAPSCCGALARLRARTVCAGGWLLAELLLSAAQDSLHLHVLPGRSRSGSGRSTSWRSRTTASRPPRSSSRCSGALARSSVRRSHGDHRRLAW